MGLLTDGGDKRSTLPKICHTYSKMMKLGTVIPYLKKTQKYMNYVTHPLISDDIIIFHWKSVNFAIKNYRCRLCFGPQFLILLTFFESLKIMVTILIMSAKLAALGLLKIRYFEIKFMTSLFLSMTSPKNLSRNSNYIVDWSCDQSLVTLAFL